MNVADGFPDELVDRVEQKSSGILMRCFADGAYSWVGGTFIYLKDEYSAEEAAALTESLVEPVSELVPEAHAAWNEYETGRVRLIADNPGGGQIRALTMPTNDEGRGAYMRVSAWSPCLYPPEDVYLGGNFSRRDRADGFWSLMHHTPMRRRTPPALPLPPNSKMNVGSLRQETSL